MKIIAKVSDNVVLCEITAQEIARLHGSDAYSTDSRDFNKDWLRVGTDHDLGRAITTLDAMRRFDERELDNLKSRLDDAMEIGRAHV